MNDVYLAKRAAEAPDIPGLPNPWPDGVVLRGCSLCEEFVWVHRMIAEGPEHLTYICTRCASH